MKQVAFTQEELGHQSHHAGTYDIVREWGDNWQGVEVSFSPEYINQKLQEANHDDSREISQDVV